MERIILTTGGTGGHIFPALAVAEEILQRRPAAEILFVGGVRGPEKELTAKAGLKFVALPTRPFLGRGPKAIFAVFWLGVSMLKAAFVHLRFKPQIVLGLGGYAAFSAVMAAALLRIPTALHEQNSVPGMANRVLGRFVKKVLLTFPVDQGMFPEQKTTLTGNPVRKGIAEAAKKISAPLHERNPRLLVLGGSQGAVAVNNAVIEALPELLAANVEITHQTGKLDHERVHKAYQEAGAENARIAPFIHDMANAYGEADIVVCRAGASTVTEMAAAGKPGIYIPFPFATHNHQYKNAMFMVQAGGGICIEQKELGRDALADTILNLLQSPDKLAEYARGAANVAKVDSSATIVTELERLAARAA